MPNWKKLIVSGSDANLNSLDITTELTASDALITNDLDVLGNVGIGTDSPSVKLHVDSGGNETIAYFASSDNRGRISIADNDTTNYVISEGSVMSLGSNSSLDAGNLNIDSDGNVGIGTTSPLVPLTLEASGLSSAGENTHLRINDTTDMSANVGGVIQLSGKATTGSSSQYTFATIKGIKENGTSGNYNGALTFSTRKTNASPAIERMRIDSDGKVGIGTTDPDAKLEVVDSSNISLINARKDLSTTAFTSTYNAIQMSNFDSTANNWAKFSFAGNSSIPTQTAASIATQFTDHSNNYGDLAFWTRGSANFGERMRIDSDGNVGIGTTSPNGLLHVSSGTSGDAVVIIESDTDNNNENDNPRIEFKQDGGGLYAKTGLTGDGAGTDFTNSLQNAAYFGTVPNIPLQLFQNGTAQITIENGGNVGIGTNSPSEKLHVTGNARVTGAYYDSANSPGTGGQVLTSTATGTDWIDPTLLPAESAEKVIQSVRFGEAVSKGDPLVITGYHGSSGPAIVEKADATNSTNMPAYGVALEDYSINATGLMIAVGDFGDFDTSGYSIGDTLYVAVGGGMTNVKPTGTGLIQNIGIVSRVNANNGQVEIVAIGRANDVPNLPEGRLFVGTSGNTSLTSDVVYIDDANDRVGIGTTSPLAKLHVFGENIYLGNGQYGQDWDTTQRRFRLYTNTNTSPYLDLGAAATYATAASTFFRTSVQGAASGRYSISVGNGNVNTNSGEPSSFSEAFTILNNGNVGISTTSPDYLFEVEKATPGSATLASFKGTENTSIRISRTGTDSGTSLLTAVNLGALYASSDSHIVFQPGNSTSVFLRSDGKVGIGTTSPQHILDVTDSGINATAPTIRLTNSANYNAAAWGGNTSHAIEFYSSDPSGNRVASTIENIAGIDKGGLLTGNLVFKTRNYPSPGTLTEKMRITEDGNVGIGTASPDTKLHVDGRITADTHFISSDLVATLSTSGSGGNIYLRPNGYNIPSGQVIIKDSGNVGIGTDVPDTNLEIDKGSEGEYLRIGGDDSNNARSLRFTSSTSSGNSNGALHTIKANSVTGEIAFANGDGNIMYLKDGGNVGIGTNNPSAKLHIAGASFKLVDTTTHQRLFVTSGNSSQSIIYLGDGDDTTKGRVAYNNASDSLYFNTNGSTKLLITSAGNVGIGTTDPQAKLQINDGNLYFKNNSYGDNNRIGFGNAARNGDAGYIDYIGVGNFTGHIAFGLVTSSSNVAASEIARFSNQGYLGIGTTNPDSKLDVKGPSATPADGNQTLSITNTTGDTQLNMGTAENSYGWIEAREGATLRNLLLNPNSGNVGIGTTSPSSKLQIGLGTGTGSDGIFIKGEFAGGTAYASSKNPFISLGTSTSAGYTSTIYLGASATATDQDSKIEFNKSNNALSIYHKGQGTYREHVRFGNPSSITPKSIFFGNVGIGVTSPSAALDVSVAYKAARFVSTQNTGLEVQGGANSQDLAIFKNPGGFTQLVIKSTGNVGIGSNFNSPSERLEVSGGNLKVSNTGSPTLILNSTNSTGAKIQALRNGATTPAMGELSWNSSTGINLQFFTATTVMNSLKLDGSNFIVTNNGSERMRIDSSGNVGIGTTSPSAKIHIVDSAEQSQVHIGSDASNYLKVDVAGDGDSTISAVGSGFLPPNIRFNTNSTTILAIDGTVGYVGIGTVSPSEKLEVDGNVQADTLIATDLNDGYVPYNRNGTLGLQDSEIYQDGGQVGIGTTTLSQTLNVDGEIISDGYRLSAMQTAPSSRGDTGTLGEIRVTADYIYVCYATNSWHRVAITNW